MFDFKLCFISVLLFTSTPAKSGADMDLHILEIPHEDPETCSIHLLTLPTILVENRAKNKVRPLAPLMVLKHRDIEQTSGPVDHSIWDGLLKAHVAANGNVDYKGFKNNWKTLLDYISYLGKNHPKANWTQEEQLAYWINAYNALTIDLVLRHYPLGSIKDIEDPWKQRLWKLGVKWYHLNEIEHQILRKMHEPRIHFAIVCASQSCPKLQNEAYTASHLEHQLRAATEAFLNDPEKNSIAFQNLELSQLFKWFARDFKKNGTLIDFLNQYTDVTISENARIRYKAYDWALNE
ncbi:DUF547 domain-containing protein [Aestuariivivens sediminicola]|uniref:DUF547 domain-containing protein n=1 Tax=Aestuariivivens sediminicola TaxID=2913560 RepID=UPI001F580C92|nr:DUF547 domain-containing protein [Aestuariivivens sediminicola]